MQGMREVLRGSLRRSLGGNSAEDRLALAWPVACGSALSAHGEVLHLDDEGWLHVRVAGAEWLGQFLRSRAVLAADLGRISGVRLAGIHFDERAEAGSRVPTRAAGPKGSRR